MKLLPEVPTKELLDAIAYGQPISASHDDIYRAMYAAAPWVKSEPVGYMGADTHYALSKGDTVCQTVTPSRVCADDVAIYTHPDPRVAELEKEVERLRGLIETHNEGCASQCEFCKKQGRCDGFVIRGLQCTDCPRDYTISDEQ